VKTIGSATVHSAAIHRNGAATSGSRSVDQTQANCLFWRARHHVNRRNVSSSDFDELRGELIISGQEKMKLIKDEGEIYIFEAHSRKSGEEYQYEEGYIGDELHLVIRRPTL
jgi:hypothetical protein